MYVVCVSVWIESSISAPLRLWTRWTDTVEYYGAKRSRDPKRNRVEGGGV